jgi:hypothetical protein
VSHLSFALVEYVIDAAMLVWEARVRQECHCICCCTVKLHVLVQAAVATVAANAVQKLVKVVDSETVHSGEHCIRHNGNLRR